VGKAAVVTSVWTSRDTSATEPLPEHTSRLGAPLVSGDPGILRAGQFVAARRA